MGKLGEENKRSRCKFTFIQADLPCSIIEGPDKEFVRMTGKTPGVRIGKVLSAFAVHEIPLKEREQGVR